MGLMPPSPPGGEREIIEISIRYKLMGNGQPSARGEPDLRRLESLGNQPGLTILANLVFLFYIPMMDPNEPRLTELERRVILALQRDLEVTPRPFLEVAELLGVPEEELLAAIRSLMDQGYIRRFGATLRHQKSGYAANALVTWRVPEKDVSAIGKKLAANREVSHCYARTPAPSWPYNLYTMIHGKSSEECARIAARLAGEVGITDYQLLFSETELKKTTMRYFKEEEGGSSG